MANPLEELMQFSGGPTEYGFAETEPKLPGRPKMPMNGFDLPIPGQSLTKPKGKAAYENPPEFTNVDDAMDFLADKTSRPDVQVNLLRFMDKGVPLTVLMEPILLHGVQEGKWNMDMALALSEPLSMWMYMLGKRAGINVKVTSPRKKKSGVDPKMLDKWLNGKKKKEENSLTFSDARDSTKPKPQGLMAPRGEKMNG